MNTEHPFPCLGQGQPWDFVLFHAPTLSCLCCFCIMISTTKSNRGALSSNWTQLLSLKLKLSFPQRPGDCLCKGKRACPEKEVQMARSLPAQQGPVVCMAVAQYPTNCLCTSPSKCGHAGPGGEPNNVDLRVIQILTGSKAPCEFPKASDSKLPSFLVRFLPLT